MTNDNNNDKERTNNEQDPIAASKKQEQTDPQLTELRGFMNPSEDLEPTLSDGTKAPDKAKEEYNDKKSEG